MNIKQFDIDILNTDHYIKRLQTLSVAARTNGLLSLEDLYSDLPIVFQQLLQLIIDGCESSLYSIIADEMLNTCINSLEIQLKMMDNCFQGIHDKSPKETVSIIVQSNLLYQNDIFSDYLDAVDYFLEGGKNLKKIENLNPSIKQYCKIMFSLLDNDLSKEEFRAISQNYIWSILNSLKRTFEMIILSVLSIQGGEGSRTLSILLDACCLHTVNPLVKQGPMEYVAPLETLLEMSKVDALGSVLTESTTLFDQYINLGLHFSLKIMHNFKLHDLELMVSYCFQVKEEQDYWYVMIDSHLAHSIAEIMMTGEDTGCINNFNDELNILALQDFISGYIGRVACHQWSRRNIDFSSLAKFIDNKCIQLYDKSMCYKLTANHKVLGDVNINIICPIFST